jgi:hypothetical protein
MSPESHTHVDTSRERNRSIDDLDRAIVSLAARINSASHDLLILIRRFDERAGWLRWGFENCADWLHWRCDISLSAAREKVRVAHALKTLPTIATAFAKGELSYSKVRALTRVADRSNEDELLAFALHTTASRVEERCRELRCGTVASTDEAMRAHARRALSVRRDPVRACQPDAALRRAPPAGAREWFSYREGLSRSVVFQASRRACGAGLRLSGGGHA